MTEAVGRRMFAIMTAEAAGGFHVAKPIGIGAPRDLHRREHVASIHLLQPRHRSPERPSHRYRHVTHRRSASRDRSRARPLRSLRIPRLQQTNALAAHERQLPIDEPQRRSRGRPPVRAPAPSDGRRCCGSRYNPSSAARPSRPHRRAHSRRRIPSFVPARRSLSHKESSRAPDRRRHIRRGAPDSRANEWRVPPEAGSPRRT